jgi:cytochrome c556
MQSHAEAYAAMVVEHARYSSKLFQQSIGSDLINAKFTLPSPNPFELPSCTPHEVQKSILQTRTERGQMEQTMLPFETAAIQRLAAALAWLDTQPCENPANGRHRHNLIEAQRPIARVIREFDTIRQGCASLEHIFANASGHPDGITLEAQAKGIALRCQIAHNHAMLTLGDTLHPYLEEGKSIRGSLHPFEPDDTPFARAFKASAISTDALMPLLCRIMGELCGIALAAEPQMQLSPPQARHAIDPTSGLPLPTLA